ncbi:hypothetical protein FV226_23245 [Methylobacterium sp. WL12]|uniref:hypothetical protein n=1 Tax=Methylobacterium sp. WL12 TaxID=2603890 RepID=UPI0011C86F5F|nr:hypothetical protein [Methylobacterium sp. WL12]TXM66639.1 hypothetical protein FV226_23245 [Methylobacterium sp. WL12]
MNEGDFKDAIASMSPLAFCRQHLFDSSAWIFTADSGLAPVGNYHDFRVTVANAINTNPNNIAIIGSGKFGFSMAPNKILRPFSERSDIDVVIVSPEVFEEVWRDIRTAIMNGYSHLKDLHRNEIILRFIVLQSDNKYSSTYLRNTAIIVAELARALNVNTRIQRPFKFRIYASWHDVELYHSEGVSRLKEGM